MMPTLMHFLIKLITNPTRKKPLLCLLASQLLKQCYPQLGLVQRAISVLLYGNGTNKQELYVSGAGRGVLQVLEHTLISSYTYLLDP